jgi:hypothetical protein
MYTSKFLNMSQDLHAKNMNSNQIGLKYMYKYPDY